jgi:hypothetical protein
MIDRLTGPKLFNRYSMLARVYPAILTFAPVIWSALVVFPSLLSDIRKLTASTLVIGCMLYLLSGLARSRGKLAEKRLLISWGSWPTTIFLRHRDDTIDPVTKARYHAALTKLGGIGKMPTGSDEAAAPADADNVYRSATKRLIEARRGKQYQMVEDENASYGFRRNTLGLRPAAVGISAVTAGTTGLIWYAALAKPLDLAAFEQSVTTYPYLPILLAADLVYMAMFLFLINRHFVRQAADEYAFALLRTLDQKQK